MKYQKDDVFAVCNGRETLIYAVMDIKPSYRGFDYELVCLDRERREPTHRPFPVRTERVDDDENACKIGSLDFKSVSSIPFVVGKIEVQRHKCNCDTFQVVHFGCKCGGI